MSKSQAGAGATGDVQSGSSSHMSSAASTSARRSATTGSRTRSRRQSSGTTTNKKDKAESTAVHTTSSKTSGSGTETSSKASASRQAALKDSSSAESSSKRHATARTVTRKLAKSAAATTETQNTDIDRPQTERFRHVQVKLDQPQLTKEGNAPAATKAKTVPSFDSPRKDKNAVLRVIPLGGLDAIGKNMTVFECNGDMIVDDCGLMFPDDNHPGVDLILPDYTYVLEHADQLRGIVITHGHEDHIGSLPYLLKDLDRQVPVYATKLTLGMIEGKLQEMNIKNAKLIEVKSGQSISLGCFTVSFFAVNHSIPDAVGIFFMSPAGNVMHTGDFKLDQTPIDGVKTDYASIINFSKIGVDLLLSDSTNARIHTFTPSEAEVGKVLRSVISQATGKVVVACFSSHIHRMQQICDAAVASGRKVVVTGRSMIQNTDIARRLGYLHIDDNNIIDAYDVKSLPPEQVVVMCTGSQGEPLSALARIAAGNHKTITIERGDTVIISATPVPGNEKAVTKVINTLAKIGAEVYDKSRALVHVSGHAGAEELKIMLTMVQPKAFLPVHGEAAHLLAHAQLAKDVGVPEENIFLLENGDTLELTTKGVRKGEPVPSGVVYVDGLSVGDTTEQVLSERSTLSVQGFAAISAAVSRPSHAIRGIINLAMCGITGGDDDDLQAECIAVLQGALQRGLAKEADSKALKKTLKDSLLSFLWDRIQQRPMVIVHLIEV